MIGPNGLEGKDVIDIFAGTGNFGISALRRGANSAIFLDINKKRCEKIKLLLNQSNFKNTNYVINGSVPKAISKISHQADIVFIDPPYDQNPFEEVMNSFLLSICLMFNSRNLRALFTIPPVITLISLISLIAVKKSTH